MLPFILSADVTPIKLGWQAPQQIADVGGRALDNTRGSATTVDDEEFVHQLAKATPAGSAPLLYRRYDPVNARWSNFTQVAASVAYVGGVATIPAGVLTEWPAVFVFFHSGGSLCKVWLQSRLLIQFLF